jgi:hypothetical protein
MGKYSHFSDRRPLLRPVDFCNYIEKNNYDICN